MNFATTMLFYLLMGGALAVAMLLRHDHLGRGERVLRAFTALLFWPLYLPLVLQGSPTQASGAVVGRSEPRAKVPATALDEELVQAIAQVEAELDLALGSLDGWSDAVLAREQDRFAELRAAWRQQAARISELDRLLAQPAFLKDGAGAESTSPRAPRVAASESARRENIQRLQAVRRRFHDDLLGTFAKVRELVTMIHLARYTGAPAARAEELVEQIAAAVTGLSEVAGWRAPLDDAASARLQPITNESVRPRVLSTG
jgi:hypothetical protein